MSMKSTIQTQTAHSKHYVLLMHSSSGVLSCSRPGLSLVSLSVVGRTIINFLTPFLSPGMLSSR
jgi:hypothetical protein